MISAVHVEHGQDYPWTCKGGLGLRIKGDQMGDKKNPPKRWNFGGFLSLKLCVKGVFYYPLGLPQAWLSVQFTCG